MSLRIRLKEQAETDLHEMELQCLGYAEGLVSGTDLSAKNLLRLAIGGRTETIKAKAVSVLVNRKEVALEALFVENQGDLALIPPATTAAEVTANTSGKK